jgi:hypothetical protein
MLEDQLQLSKLPAPFLFLWLKAKRISPASIHIIGDIVRHHPRSDRVSKSIYGRMNASFLINNEVK